MTGCDAELCQYWTGHGCACEVFDIALVDSDGMCHDCYDGGAPIYV